MNISGYIAANSWGYDVTKVSQRTSIKSFDVSTEKLASEKQTQKTLNNANSDPFKASSFNFKDWSANLDPNYDIQMLSKTEATRSDEEILKDMTELAKKQAKQGTFQEHDEEFLSLYKEYVSSVSPDRECILNRAMNEVIERTNQNEDYTMSDIYQQIKAQIAEQEEEDDKDKKEPIDYFLEALKNKEKGIGNEGTISNTTQNSDYYEVNVDHGGGMTTTFSYINGELAHTRIGGNNYSILNHGSTMEYGTFKDDNGEVIASFGRSQGEDGIRFHGTSTKAEVEREKEILGAYNDAYREYKAYV